MLDKTSARWHTQVPEGTPIDETTRPIDDSRDLGEVLIDREQLRLRVSELGKAISDDYQGTVPLLVGVLRGPIIFMADLIRDIDIHVEVDFIAVSSYGPTTHSSGVVRFLKDLNESIVDRHVILVEDIVDTGLTLRYILRTLQGRNPASLAICSLLNKQARRFIDIDIQYKGFDIPDVFVVGYGLDYQQRYRNLPFICRLKPEVYET